MILDHQNTSRLCFFGAAAWPSEADCACTISPGLAKCVGIDSGEISA